MAADFLQKKPDGAGFFRHARRYSDDSWDYAHRVGDRVDTDIELQVDLQRVLCAINRTVFKPGDRGDWRAPARGSADLMIAGHQVSELRRLGLVDIATNSALVPTESGRQSYRVCAARGHGKHLER